MQPGEAGLVSNMTPSLKSEKDDNKQKIQRNHHHQNNSVVKLVTRGKLSGHFSQRHFRKLPPLVTIHLRDIVSEQFRTEGHICLGFTKRGRYILTYTKEVGTRPPRDDLEPGYFYVLCWWEFDLHRKLKPVQDVYLFGSEVRVRDMYLSVCEWPSDESKVVVFGSNAHSSTTNSDDHRLMNMIPPDDQSDSCVFGITIVSNPPSKPCPPCSLAQDECLEHGYMLHSVFGTDPPYVFQPAFQLKIDKVLLLKSTVKLEACCIYLCPAAGEQSRSSQMLYTESAPPSSQEASVGKPRYLNYTRRYYCLPQADDDEEEDHQDTGDDENDADPLLPQPGAAAAEPDTEHLELDELDDDHRRPFFFTDLQGSDLQLVTGPRDNGQTLCVEQLTLNIKDFIHDSIHDIRPDLKLSTIDTLYKNSFLAYDMVILETCPETNTVMMDIGLLVCGNCRHKVSLQVSWELDTGLCCFAGGNSIDTTEVNDHSCETVNTAMDLLAPGNSYHRVNVMTNEALPGGALEHADRCTRVLL